jgi:flagella basal body P-ring formation protein FlgA
MCLSAVAFVVTSVCGPAAADAAELDPQWQSVEEIVATAESFFLERFGQADARLVVDGAYLDPRLQLPRCSSQLQGFTQGSFTPSSRAVIGVRCDGEKPWKIYVPIGVKIMDSVVVAAEALPRGHALTLDDILVVERDVSRLSSGYLNDPESLPGQRLKQQLLAGRVITPAMLLEETVVKRGQRVTILAQSGGLTIQMAGTALMDGTADERIKVENAESKRVVEAVVRSSELVEVPVY